MTQCLEPVLWCFLYLRSRTTHMALPNCKSDGTCGGNIRMFSEQTMPQILCVLEHPGILPWARFSPQSCSLLADPIQCIDLVCIQRLQLSSDPLIHLFSYLLSIFIWVSSRHPKLTVSTQTLQFLPPKTAHSSSSPLHFGKWQNHLPLCSCNPCFFTLT